MDRARAKRILRVFRERRDDPPPDDFESALQTVAADPELSRWLARERGRDADFERALREIALPEGLRDDILAATGPAAAEPSARDDLDPFMETGLAAVAPPTGLRDEVLAAMSKSAPADRRAARGWWKFAAPLAAAAGIVFALVIGGGEVSRENPAPASAEVAAASAIPVSRVIDSTISHLTRPDFHFDLAEPDHDKLFARIRKRGMPCPAGEVPAGLARVPALGCSFVEIGEHRAAVVCFRLREREFAHLIVVSREQVEAAGLPTEIGRVSRYGAWSATRWCRDDRVFVLLTKGAKEDLERMF